jgi:uncharacterized protein
LNPGVWTHRVPAKYRDRAPKVVQLENGSDGIQTDGGEAQSIGITRNVGVPFEELPLVIPKFSEPVGNGTPQQRVQEQDQDGVDAEIMFTWAERMFRDAKDDDLYRSLISTYNEYLAEEYASAAPDRLFPMGTLPTCGLDDAVRELEHCAQLGFKGVTVQTFPSGRGFPTPEDDRFWAAALDLNMPIAVHGGGRFGGFGGAPAHKGDPVFKYPRVLHSPDNHKADALDLLFSNTGAKWAMGVMQLAYAGVFDRFPKLQLYFAETMAGWIPFCLFMLDDNYRRYQPMMRHFWGVDDLERPPSEYMREHTQWGTLYDVPGIQNRDAIGTDRLLFATDFPHAAGDWPNNQQFIADMFEGVPESEKHAILAGNAVKYFHLNEG